MKLFYLLLAVLIFLLGIILLAGLVDPINHLTGVPHPDYKGMLIAPETTDHHNHTKWLGYLFGCGVLGLFLVMLLIGNRKKGKITSIGSWIMVGMFFYFIGFSLMVFSNWGYVHSESNEFVFQMPKPTAWMIYVVWFIPLIITISYIVRFEDSIISHDEIVAFQEFLKEQSQ